MCICMAESLPRSPEMVTTWLIDYTPIQNKKFKRKIPYKKRKQNSSLEPEVRAGLIREGLSLFFVASAGVF